MPVIVRRPDVYHAIIGTAGHVDHGKTSLVRLLTGCDTDRLPEEKARGMSIDLGFAPCMLTIDGESGPADVTVGLVDVPGHRDFIRNMVAGAASIDVLLLVIAADDGPMPQTLEHVQIVTLLRHSEVLVALTKVDLVSPARLAEAHAEVTAFLDRFGLAAAPVIDVSNKTGEGVGEVRETLERLVLRARTAAGDARAFRMNVERVFSVKGFGSVVTGIPISGTVNVGDRLELLPAGTPVTVRAIQRYKAPSSQASAACCCAINVHGIEATAVARGMTLASPGVYRATQHAILALRNVTDTREIPRRNEVMLHSGTAAVHASMQLLDVRALAPGESAFAALALDEPLTLAAGDCYIVRSLLDLQTLGGGVVLSARLQHIPRHELLSPRLVLAGQAAVRGEYLACEVLAAVDAFLDAAEARRLSQHSDPAGQAAQLSLLTEVRPPLATDLGGIYLVQHRLGQVIEAAARHLDAFHRANPHTPGDPIAHLCEVLGVPRSVAGALLPPLCGAGRIVQRNGLVALASFTPALPDRLASRRDGAIALITAAGVNGIARGTLSKELTLTDAELAELTRILVPQHAVLLDGNFLHQPVFEQCRDKLLALFASRDRVDLAAFRGAIGSARKMAVAMLDAFDRQGLTRRVGDARQLMPRHAGKPSPIGPKEGVL